MNLTRNISLELLDHTIQNDSFVLRNEYNNNLTISLDDIYDTISLYDDFGSNQSKTSGRLTWEEWYLKKRIESLKNEKKLHEKMQKKINEKSNERYSKLTPEEKNKKLFEWVERKRAEKEKLEKQLKAVMEENQRKKAKQEIDRKKGEEKYKIWLDELKRREKDEKEKQIEREINTKLKQEEDKKKKEEQQKRIQDNMKKTFKARLVSQKKGFAFVNGKLCSFDDWSTSPEPSFVNQAEWKS